MTDLLLSEFPRDYVYKMNTFIEAFITVENIYGHPRAESIWTYVKHMLYKPYTADFWHPMPYQ